jgi:hypothetical protein
MPKRVDEPFARGKEDEARLRELCAASRRDGWTWPAIGAGVGLAGGGVAPVVGALLSAGAWAGGGDQTHGLSLHGAGSVLLLAAIPLLLLGGHCLDLLEKRIGNSRLTIPATSGVPERAARVNRHARPRAAATLLALLCATHSQTRARQTLFNAPSTDVLDKGKVYAEPDTSLKPMRPVKKQERRAGGLAVQIKKH